MVVTVKELGEPTSKTVDGPLVNAAGSRMVTAAPALLERLPAASLAKAFRMCSPPLTKL